MNAETRQLASLRVQTDWTLQWGRVLMNAETPTRLPLILLHLLRLQWGRVLMNAETDRSTTLCEIKAFSLVIERSLYARARTGSWAASSWLKPLVVKEHERRRALGHLCLLFIHPALSNDVVRKAIARGVQTGLFGYATGRPNLGTMDVTSSTGAGSHLKGGVADDEIDLDSGFLVVPKALPEKPGRTDHHNYWRRSGDRRHGGKRGRRNSRYRQCVTICCRG